MPSKQPAVVRRRVRKSVRRARGQTLGDGANGQDGGLALLPLGTLEALEDGRQDQRQDGVAIDCADDVQCSRSAFSFK